jgi:acetyl-CoA carboxylase biotin carboxyl carrier protein
MKGTKNNKKAPAKFAIPGMDGEQLEMLLDFMAAHGLEEFEYKHKGVHIRLKKAAAPSRVSRPAATAERAAVTSVPRAMPPAPGAEGGQTAGEPSEASQGEELHVIKSPIVGTFYDAPSPEAPPFLKVGDVIQSGQVVCIVEAMKLMNEIEADVSGEVVRILVESGQPVEYGQGLYAIRPTRKKK